MTRRRLLAAATVAVALAALWAARLWLFDGLQVTYTVAARILALYGLALLGLFVWRDRIHAAQIRELHAWREQLCDWLDHDQADDVDELDRPTPEQQAAPTVPDLAAQHPTPRAGRHRAST